MHGHIPDTNILAHHMRPIFLEEKRELNKRLIFTQSASIRANGTKHRDMVSGDRVVLSWLMSSRASCVCLFQNKSFTLDVIGVKLKRDIL